MAHNTRRMYCVAKCAQIKSRPTVNSRTITVVPFCGQVNLLSKKPVNGMIYVDVVGTDHIRGWTSPRGFTKKFIRNQAGLFYCNKTGKLIPVTNAFQSRKIVGYIRPGEMVRMIADVDGWGLTEKLWTRFDLLTKDRTICDETAMDALVYSVVALAGKDFRSCVRRLRDGKCTCDLDFMITMERLIEVSEWLLSDEYKKVYAPPLRTSDPLGTLMAEEGVSKEWFKEQLKHYDELMATRNIYHPKKRKARQQ